MAKVKSYTEILLHINSQLNEQEVKNWLTLRKKDVPPGNLESFKHDILEFFRHMETRDIYTEKKYHSLLGDLENLGLISLKNEVEEMFCLLNSASLSQYSKISRPSSLVGNTSVPSTASAVGYASGGGASMHTPSSTQSMHIKQCEENIQIIEETGNMSLENIDELFSPKDSLKDGISTSGRHPADVDDITGDLSNIYLEYSAPVNKEKREDEKEKDDDDEKEKCEIEFESEDEIEEVQNMPEATCSTIEIKPDDDEENIYHEEKKEEMPDADVGRFEASEGSWPALEVAQQLSDEKAKKEQEEAKIEYDPTTGIENALFEKMKEHPESLSPEEHDLIKKQMMHHLQKKANPQAPSIQDDDDGGGLWLQTGKLPIMNAQPESSQSMTSEQPINAQQESVQSRGPPGHPMQAWPESTTISSTQSGKKSPQHSKTRPSALVSNTSVSFTSSSVGYASSRGARMHTLSSTQSTFTKEYEENTLINDETGSMSVNDMEMLFSSKDSLKDGITMSGRYSDEVADITGDLSEMKLEYSDEPTIDARSRPFAVSKDGSGHAGSVGIDRMYQSRIEVEPLHGRPPPLPEHPPRRPEITVLELCQMSRHFDAGVINLFGLELGYSSERISQLMYDSPRDVSNVFYRLMVDWRSAQHGNSNMRESLANHLRNIKCTELAHDLEGGRFRR